mmetsp:Transcript_36362/g.66563  ORF Transcript_36362/g.66563 Transcript_36362/m.66563 type:complete len:267 (+) Transcript_36362:55-855(+)
MGSGSSALLKPSKAQMARAKRMSRKKSVQNEQNEFFKSIMVKFDASKTGSLSNEEVKKLMETILCEVTPMMGGVTDEDVLHVMRIGGETVKPEITYEELPLALSVLLATKAENMRIYELFTQHDTDGTGKLPIDQLKAFMTSVNEGIIPLEREMSFVISQFDKSGDGAIELPELRAAVAAWYAIVNNEDMPTSREEAIAMGYTEEEIDDFIKEVEAMPDSFTEEPEVPAAAPVAEAAAEVEAPGPTPSAPAATAVEILAPTSVAPV